MFNTYYVTITATVKYFTSQFNICVFNHKIISRPVFDNIYYCLLSVLFELIYYALLTMISSVHLKSNICTIFMIVGWDYVFFLN